MNNIEYGIRKYFEAKAGIAAVYVFGSRASGKERPASDVDIGILFCRGFSESAEELKQQYLVELGRVLRKDVHLVIMNNAGELLLKQILSKGRPVLVKDSAFDKKFRMISISRIADFNFYLQKMQKGLKKKILEA